MRVRVHTEAQSEASLEVVRRPCQHSMTTCSAPRAHRRMPDGATGARAHKAGAWTVVVNEGALRCPNDAMTDIERAVLARGAIRPATPQHACCTSPWSDATAHQGEV